MASTMPQPWSERTSASRWELPAPAAKVVVTNDDFRLAEHDFDAVEAVYVIDPNTCLQERSVSRTCYELRSNA